MKIAKESLRWLFALLVIGTMASATTLSIPNTFVSGTTISSAAMNSNFNSIATWSNQIDNSNIGANGIYASQIVPLSGPEATFGGAQLYTFTQSINDPGEIFATPVATPTANAVWCQNDNGSANGLVCNIPSGSTGFQFQSAGAGIARINTTAVSFTGTETNPGLILATPVATPTANAVYAINDNGATNGMTLNVPSGSTNGYQFDVAHVQKMQITNAGAIIAKSTIKGLCSGCSNAAYVPEAYQDQTGAAGNSAMHMFPWNTSFGISGTCSANTVCTLTSNTLTFTGDAPFTSGVVSCTVTGDFGANANSGKILWSFDYTDFVNNSINMQALNTGPGSATGTIYVHGICLGY